MNALNPVRRVGDQIAEPIEVRLGQPREASRRRAAELLDLVGIPKKRSTAYPHELSGGMRQRAMIAMALACDPAIVIGDEPTTALDVMVQAQILQLLEQLRRDLGLSLILITHDLSVIAETCDTVMVMYAGRVAEEGPVRRLFTAPRHPYTQALLSAYPNIHADRRTLEVIPGMPPDLRNPPPGCRFAPALRVRDARLHRGRAARGHVRRRRPGRLPPVPDRRRADGGRGRPNAGDPADRRPRCGHRSRRSRGRRMTDSPDGREPAHHEHGVVPHEHEPGEQEAAAAAAAVHAASHDPTVADRPAHPAHVHAPGPPSARLPADAPVLLSVEGLQVHFQVRGGMFDGLTRRPRSVVRAVDGIDLSIRKGEILGLVGESGSGKTTTGRVIVKLTRQTGGRVVFDGADVSDLWGTRALREYRRRVQLIFQDPYETLNPKHTIGEFVAEPLDVNHLASSRADRDAKVTAALEAAGLRPAADFAGRYPHELSGGQRQRVVIAGALVMGPELIVADEPVSMLDVSIRTELLRLMLDLRQEHGLTYLFITHDLAVAWVLADRIAVMYLGRIMEIGPAEEVIRAPRNPYTQALVSVSPSPDPPEAGDRAHRTILVGETPDAAHIPTGCRFHPRCPLAFDRCRVEEPPLLEVAPGHKAACWLAQAGERDLPIIDAVGAVEPDAGGAASRDRRRGRARGRRGVGPACARPGWRRRAAAPGSGTPGRRRGVLRANAAISRALPPRRAAGPARSRRRRRPPATRASRGCRRRSARRCRSRYARGRCRRSRIRASAPG